MEKKTDKPRMPLLFVSLANHADPIANTVGPSMTDQQFAKECDINFILKRFIETGVLPNARGSGVFIDCSQIGDFASLMQKVDTARSRFADLPSDIRSRFGHDAAAFLDFVSNPDNKDECIRLGIFNKKEEVEDALSVLKSIRDKFPVTPKEEDNSASSGFRRAPIT